MQLLKKRLLLVEDDLPKQNQVIDVLRSEDCIFDIAKSINPAIALIDGNKYDGIVLDMSLPTFNEGIGLGSSGRQHDFGGRQILTYMWELEIKTSVLLVTQLPGFRDSDGVETRLSELDARLRNDFPGLYLGYTSFQHSTNAWIDDLKFFVKNL